MTTSQFGNQGLDSRDFKRVRRLQVATLVMLGTVALSSTIAAGWFAGEGRIH